MPGARRRWPRVLVGTLIVLLASTGLASAGVYLWLNDVLSETPNAERADQIADVILGEEPEESTVTTEPGRPRGVNILLMGSDRQEEEGETYGRSDTLMLVHVDPDNDYASVLSLPRDLRVRIPGYGRDKINAAYALGGPALAIETVRDLTGMPIDHYANIDFDAFRQVTEELGGIYVDVDKDYYPPRGATWEFIDLEPGYQALKGEDALDYVRFRHDQNGDFGRIERQQRFLRAAKEQAFKWDLGFQVPALVRLVSRNVETDLGTTDVLKLAWWAIKIGQERVKQVTLEADLDMIDGISYVVASETAIANAVDQLTVAPVKSLPSTTTTEAGEQEEEPEEPASTTTSTVSGPVRPDLRGVTVDVLNGNGRSGEGAAAARYLTSLGATVNRVGDAASFGQQSTTVAFPADGSGAASLVAQALDGQLQADSSQRVITVTLGMDFRVPEEAQATASLPTVPDGGTWKTLASQATFAVMAPGDVPYGYGFADRRLYEIDTEDGPKPALKAVYKRWNEDQYLGFMQTTFLDAPAAAGGEEVKDGDTTFHLVYHDEKVDRVWWKTDGVVYWLSNTMSYRLTGEELLAMARSMVMVQ
jgi:LCP family protein required for cell wall assembly